MTRRIAVALVTMFTVTTMITGTALAHPGHEQKVMGTVTMAAADHVMLKTTDGKDAMVGINKNTKFVRARKR